jgi:hypothetical protein
MRFVLIANRRQSKSGNSGAYVCESVSPDNGLPMNRRGLIYPLGDSSNAPHCIDGCSTPSLVASTLFIIGITQSLDTQGPAMGGGDNGPTSFYGACAARDQCYQTCRGSDKSTCDDNMLITMNQACEQSPSQITTKVIPAPTGPVITRFTLKDACLGNARIYRLGLEAAGGAYKSRKQQFCDCCGE